MNLEIIALLIFSISFILATIFRGKTDAIIQEFERISRRCINPDFSVYQTLTHISIIFGSIAVGMLLVLFI